MKTKNKSLKPILPRNRKRSVAEATMLECWACHREDISWVQTTTRRFSSYRHENEYRDKRTLVIGIMGEGWSNVVGP